MTRSPGLIAWIGCIAALATILAVEVRSMGAESTPVPGAGAGTGPGTGAVTAGGSTALPTSSRVIPMEAILARPLFTRGRRLETPTAATVAAIPAPPGLPRLAGVLVNGPDRSAILIPAGGGAAVVGREGSAVAGVTIRAIQAGQVTVSAADGERVLRPSFDRRRPATASLSPNLPQAGSIERPPADAGMGPPSGLAR